MFAPESATLRKAFLALAFFCFVLLSACGSGGSVSITNPTPTPTPTPTPANKADHVVLIVLENTNYTSVIGSPDAPYLNSLLPTGTLAVNYYANVHPSIGNYFFLTTGQLVSADDNFTGTAPAPEMATEEAAASKTWKVYAEGLPSIGYVGGDTGTYLKRHNPFAYFSDVAGTPTASNIVPFTQLATDIPGTLPNFTMLVPDIYDTGHNCRPNVTTCTTSIRVQQADAFLKSTVPQILANASFQTSGLLAITFDESENDVSFGGGHVATVLLGTNVKKAYQAAGTYQHPSLLRLMLQAQGITSLPNTSAIAPDMGEVWK